MFCFQFLSLSGDDNIGLAAHRVPTIVNLYTRSVKSRREQADRPERVIAYVMYGSLQPEWYAADDGIPPE